MSDNLNNVLLVGTGNMAKEYVKVLDELDVSYKIIGNSKESVDKFQEETNKLAYRGGIEKYLNEEGSMNFKSAIISVNGSNLFKVADLLIDAGVKKILIEKPGVIKFSEINALLGKAERKGALIWVAYNRRFYVSVKEAQRIIEEDGGLKSVNFEFTEWQHVVKETKHPSDIKQKWFLMNSSHVVDLVFYLAGNPKEIHTQKAGMLDWHHSGSIYAGSGITERGVIFTYQANWEAPGRWGIELLTEAHRLYLRPMEKLQVQNIGSVQIEPYQIEDGIDLKFKAGLYDEVRAFLYEDIDIKRLCTLEEQKEHMKIYQEISGEEY